MKALLLTIALVTLPAFAAEKALPSFSTDSDQVFRAARKEKKPVLISFFGIWCPPCNELEETVFESRSFLEKAKAFKLLKIDADAKSSWKLKDKYRVGGYPTIVFTNPKGEEIYHFSGYRSPDEFLKVMDLVLSAKGTDLLAACKSKQPDDIWRCAAVCVERKDDACARSAFVKLEGKLAPGSPRFEQARTYFVENAKTPVEKREGYEHLLSEFNLGPQAVVWAFDYLDLVDDEKDAGAKPNVPVLQKVLARLPTILNDPELEAFGVSPTDVLQLNAMLFERVGQMSAAKKAWKSLATTLEAMAAGLPKGSSARGFTLERIHALAEGGDSDAAVKLADDYRTRFPDEFTFHFLAATLRHQKAQDKEALPIAKRAYDVSYGDNRIRAATLLIQLYASVPDRAAAAKIYEEATQQAKPDPSLKVRTGDYLKRLDEAWSQFAKSGK